MTPRSAVHAVLFDLDGTLTDSRPGIINSVIHALGRLGLPALPDEQLRAFVGPPLHDSFASLGIEPEAAVAAYREYFVDLGIYENSVYDGIPAVLDELLVGGLPVAVATSKPTVFALRVLDHFGLTTYFQAVHGAELDGTNRHKHEVVALALQSLDVDAASAVLVGDRAADAIGAAACGVPFIGAGWGYAEPGELEAAGATVIASTPADLLPLLLTAGHQPDDLW